MKTVKVTYQVRPEFVEQNKKNIQAIMDYLKANPIDGMYYSSYLLSDDGTFMHINIALNAEIMSQLNAVQAFIHFRTQLKASEPLKMPSAENIELLGASWPTN